MFINVNDYSHLSCDSDMINSAVKDAIGTGKAVIIPKINGRTGRDIWEITKTIYLYDETTVIINNAHLRLGDNTICQMFANANRNLPLTKENRQKNITIKGMGSALLDGGNHNGIYEKNGIARKVPQKTDKKATDNIMIMLKNVENVVVEGIHIKDQRYWGLVLCMASYSRVSNVRFTSSANVPNQDGIGIHIGCNNITVENISGCVGDNLIALCAITVTDKYEGLTSVSDGDIHNITIRNIMGYGVCGCSLIRLLNHDGFKMYNIFIDNVIETSSWSDKDSSVAQNPDLLIKTDDDGNIIPWKKQVVGEKGYRIESTIIIGESYWYNKSKAQKGDTFGITVSNVMSHSRFAVWINNTLTDSYFNNIRVFGNGYMATYFGEGEFENLTFDNVGYDISAKPLVSDENILIEWNNTKSTGFHSIYFNGPVVKNVNFNNFTPCRNISSTAGGFGKGKVKIKLCDGTTQEFNLENGVEI